MREDPSRDRPALPEMGSARVTGGWWGEIATMHRDAALAHQVTQLEASGAIGAFRIAAQVEHGVPSVDFTSDSDVYKWLDAVARTLPDGPSAALVERFEGVLDLVAKACAEDGYVNTWVSTLFPDGRFQNLLTEHESYTIGHLIEAGVSLFEATGDDRLLAIARRSADLLVARHAAGDRRQDGHEEISLALVRLYRCTKDRSYLDLARDRITERGTSTRLRRQSAADHVRTGRRLLSHARRRSRAIRHRHQRPAVRFEHQPVRITARIAIRTVRSFAAGRQWQNDRPVTQLIEPTGHAVGFVYVHTAAAMIARELADDALRDASISAWERMVTAHLFVSGGIGAYPGVEGFGDPYDLDPERAYAETCAALSCLVWNRELGLVTGEACHDDLLEWQLLNAATVGMGLDGASYAYNNPLHAPPGFDRRVWYPVPCCPSNLSRNWASLATLTTSQVDSELRLHQFLSSTARLGRTAIEIDSALPFQGDVVIRLAPATTPAATADGSTADAESVPFPTVLAFRVPSWTDGVTVSVDGTGVEPDLDRQAPARATASGLDPWQARWARIPLPERGSSEIRLHFGLPIRFPRQDARIPRSGGAVAVARGPLLYCLEGVDAPDLGWPQLSSLTLDPDSVEPVDERDLLGGIVTLTAQTSDGRSLRLVPSYAWGNRGASGRVTFFRT